MPTQKSKFRIKLNLINSQGTIEKIHIRFLKWLLNYGRFIVVAVEIIVLGTFLARFKLDADLANLKDSINKQVPYIESLASTEAIIRQTQFRLSSFESLSQTSNSFTNTLISISSQTPSSIKLSNVSINRSQNKGPLQFKLSGEAQNNSSVNAFLKGLREQPSFKNVALTNISLEKGVANFTISGDII